MTFREERIIRPLELALTLWQAEWEMFGFTSSARSPVVWIAAIVFRITNPAEFDGSE